MAELVEPYDGLPEFDRDQYEDYSDFMDEERAAFNELQNQQPDDPDEEGLEGTMLRFPQADGYAHYRVVGTDPLQIQHIPFGDAYRIPAAHVRGLREEDVRQQLERREALSNL